jgi:hypothetical protein
VSAHRTLRGAAALLAAAIALVLPPACASAAGKRPKAVTAPTCSGTLSGAATGKFQCVVSVTKGAEGQIFFVITPKDAIRDVPVYAPGAFELPEPPAVTRYTLETLGMGKASVALEKGALYTAAKTSGQRGEVELTFTRVQKDAPAPGAWTVQGRYHARLLPAGAGKTGEVVVDVKF